MRPRILPRQGALVHEGLCERLQRRVVACEPVVGLGLGCLHQLHAQDSSQSD